MILSCTSNKKYEKLHGIDVRHTKYFTLQNLEKSTLKGRYEGNELRLTFLEILLLPKEEIILYKGVDRLIAFDLQGNILYENTDIFPKIRYYNYLTTDNPSFVINILDEKFTKIPVKQINESYKDRMKAPEVLSIYDELYPKADVVFHVPHSAYFLVDNQFIMLYLWDFMTENRRENKDIYPWVWASYTDRENQPLIDKGDFPEIVSFVTHTENSDIGTIKCKGFQHLYHQNRGYVPNLYIWAEHHGYGLYNVTVNQDTWKVKTLTYKNSIYGALDDYLLLYGLPSSYQTLSEVRFLVYPPLITGDMREENCTFVIKPKTQS